MCDNRRKSEKFVDLLEDMVEHVKWTTGPASRYSHSCREGCELFEDTLDQWAKVERLGRVLVHARDGCGPGCGPACVNNDAEQALAIFGEFNHEDDESWL